MSGAGDAGEPVTDVAVDAHYYDAGLKITRLAGGTVQPAWVPANPGDAVGLHQAFDPQPGDRIVEISRLRTGAQALTWIAVYRRFADASYGDRNTYAGVGVWLLNQAVLSPEFLLSGLDTLTSWLTEKGVPGTEKAAQEFLYPDNLPRYLQRLQPMPAGLAGWSFSSDLLPLKELYQTEVDDPAIPSWRLVADQLTRMTILAGPTPSHARALILMRPTSSAGPGPVPGVRKLESGLAGELVRALPVALADLEAGTRSLRRQHQAATDQIAALQTELARTQVAEKTALGRVTELEVQIAADQPDKRLDAIQRSLEQIDRQTRSNDNGLSQLRADLRTLQTELRAARAACSAAVPLPRTEIRPMVWDEPRPAPSTTTVDGIEKRPTASEEPAHAAGRFEPELPPVSPSAETEHGLLTSMLGLLGFGTASPVSRSQARIPSAYTPLIRIAAICILVGLLVMVVILMKKRREEEVYRPPQLNQPVSSGLPQGTSRDSAGDLPLIDQANAAPLNLLSDGERDRADDRSRVGQPYDPDLNRAVTVIRDR